MYILPTATNARIKTNTHLPGELLLSVMLGKIKNKNKLIPFNK